MVTVTVLPLSEETFPKNLLRTFPKTDPQLFPKTTVAVAGHLFFPKSCGCGRDETRSFFPVFAVEDDELPQHFCPFAVVACSLLQLWTMFAVHYPQYLRSCVAVEDETGCG